MYFVILNYTMDCGLFGVRFLLLGIKRELLLHRCLLIYFATAPLNSLKTASYSCEKILFLFHRKMKSCIIMKSDSGICTNIPSFNSCLLSKLKTLDFTDFCPIFWYNDCKDFDKNKSFFLQFSYRF